MTTLWRLDTSPYFPAEFLAEESNLAHNLGLAYGAENTPKDTNDSSILISNTHTQVNQLEPKLLEKTKLLIHANSGHDNIPYSWVQAQKFPIVLGNEIRAQAVANHILSQLFSHYSFITKQESWHRNYSRRLLQELKVLIIGHGSIGKILAAALRPLCGELTVYDPFKGKQNSLLGHDVIIPVPSLTISSKGMIDGAFLRQQSSDFCLINSSRGEVVNLQELIEVLREKPKAHAYLDVFPKEPTPFDDFDVNNLSCTSHIAGVFRNIHQETLHFEKRVLTSFLTKSYAEFYHENKSIILNERSAQEFP